MVRAKKGHRQQKAPWLSFGLVALAVVSGVAATHKPTSTGTDDQPHGLHVRIKTFPPLGSSHDLVDFLYSSQTCTPGERRDDPCHDQPSGGTRSSEGVDLADTLSQANPRSQQELDQEAEGSPFSSILSWYLMLSKNPSYSRLYPSPHNTLSIETTSFSTCLRRLVSNH